VHIAKLKEHIARQRIIITKLRLTNAPLDTARSMLEALKGSLRVFERHRELILDNLGTNKATDSHFLDNRSRQCSGDSLPT